MCGIATIHSSTISLTKNLGDITAMMNALRHRGPDGEGVHEVAGQILMGHRRLAIIDQAGGQQPMLSPDGRFSLVFNGEIYNYLELRQDLQRKGIAFKTFSDSEVLLQMLIVKGVEGLAELNGMYAFVFHDRQANSWIAARDPLGIKPLYYFQSKDLLLFASEIKGLLAHPKSLVSLTSKGFKTI